MFKTCIYLQSLSNLKKNTLHVLNMHVEDPRHKIDVHDFGNS